MANFQEYIPELTSAEGGYQNNPTDWRGNTNSLGQLVGTNHGISAPVFEDFLGYPPTENDVRNMSKSIALQIFKQKFWDKLRADEIQNQAVAEIFVDQYINAPKKAVLYMQQAINDLGITTVTEDNHFGTQTLKAINMQNPKDLFDAYKQKRIQHYENVKNWDLQLYNTYINGWLARVNHLAEKHYNLLSNFVKKNPKSSFFGLFTTLLLIGLFIDNLKSFK